MGGVIWTPHIFSKSMGGSHLDPHGFSKWLHRNDQALAYKQLWVSYSLTNSPTKKKSIFLETLIRAHFQKDLILNNSLGKCEKKV